MGLVQLYMVKCAKCGQVADVLGPLATPTEARVTAQKRGWQRLPCIYNEIVEGRVSARTNEDYCPRCAPMIKSEYREIKERWRLAREAQDEAIRVTPN